MYKNKKIRRTSYRVPCKHFAAWLVREIETRENIRTRTALAQRLGTTCHIVSGWTLCLNAPTTFTLFRICLALTDGDYSAAEKLFDDACAELKKDMKSVQLLASHE